MLRDWPQAKYILENLLFQCSLNHEIIWEKSVVGLLIIGWPRVELIKHVATVNIFPKESMVNTMLSTDNN